MDIRKLVGSFVSVHRLFRFFPDVYRFPDPPVNSVAVTVSHLGTVPVYDVVERDDNVCDGCADFIILLCCCGFVWKVSINELRGLRICNLTS